jgi:hypothetical protein
MRSFADRKAAPATSRACGIWRAPSPKGQGTGVDYVSAIGDEPAFHEVEQSQFLLNLRADGRALTVGARTTGEVRGGIVASLAFFENGATTEGEAVATLLAQVRLVAKAQATNSYFRIHPPVPTSRPLPQQSATPQMPAG